jgi:biopolymer transport protein ExbD
MNSKLNKNDKSKNIQQINNFFNITYTNLKKKLNLDIKAAQAQAQAQAEAQIIKINKNALLIGCNYTGTQYQLNGCINDVEHIQNKLKTQYGFNNILIMTDNTTKKPTKANILDEIKNLLTNSNSGDKLFLAFSGHGTYMKDTSGDEKDGLDEMFVPLDFNCISDDEIKIFINNNLKKDVTLFALFDCCHSGTILDLRYQYLDSENYDNSTENIKETETVGNLIMISGCRDNQFSADAYINSKYQGAMTWAFLDTVNKNPNLTWKDLITTMRSSLKTSKYEQIPQLSSGNKLDLNNKICLL